MGGSQRAVGRTIGRLVLGILLFWAFVPIIVVIGFLGWATFAASGIWQVIFGVATALLVAALTRWALTLVKRRAHRRAEAATSSARSRGPGGRDSAVDSAG